jgi:hypothetical protein
VVRTFGCLGGAQIVRGGLPRAIVLDDIERDALSLIQCAETGSFDGADMDENVLRAILWLNETEAFLVVKPLYSTFIHKVPFTMVYV